MAAREGLPIGLGVGSGAGAKAAPAAAAIPAVRRPIASSLAPKSKVLPKAAARTVTPPTARVPPTALAAAKSQNNGHQAANAQVDELSNQVTDLKLNLEGLEKERDFYFSKLRDIEILCQEDDEANPHPLIPKILDILYATEDGFAPPEEAAVEEEEY